LARQLDGGSPQRGFHDPARCAKDVRRARAGAQRVVELAVWQVFKLDAVGFDHPGQFPCGDDRVRGGDLAIDGVFRPTSLVLFGDAWHHGYHVHVFGLGPNLFRIVRLDQRAHHLHGRLARRSVGDHFGVELFKEVDPPWAARCQQRKVFARLHPAQKLGGLFHDG